MLRQKEVSCLTVPVILDVRGRLRLVSLLNGAPCFLLCSPGVAVGSVGQKVDFCLARVEKAADPEPKIQRESDTSEPTGLDHFRLISGGAQVHSLPRALVPTAEGTSIFTGLFHPSWTPPP